MNKKIYLLGLCVAASAALTNAQQLPNVGFDNWKGACGESINTAGSGSAFTRPGDEPTSWNGSSVVQVLNIETTEKDTEGDNIFVSLTNKSAAGVSNVPAFISLSNPWVFVYGNGFIEMLKYASAGDGGSYGGVEFSNKPDAISLKYKRTAANGEKAHVIAYLWNGTYKSNAPTSVSGSSESGFVYTYSRELENVDRVILGKQKDGETITQQGKLIAARDYEIVADAAEWTNLTVDLDYSTYGNSSETPTMVNVIISSADYWTRSNIQADSQLDVDDVDFVYYSTLTALEVKGEAVNFEDGKYVYAMSGTELPTAEQIKATTKSQFAEAAVSVDAANAQVRIVVTNQGGKDVDGETSHTYVLQYEKAVEAASYEGYLNIALMGSQLAYNQSAAIEIADKEEGLCTFSLPDFNLGGTPFGDIVVDDVTVVEADGVKTYSGSVDGLTLAGGIVADVELSGTIDADNVCDFNINVTWNSLPISVTFTTEMVGTDYEGYLNVSSEALGGQLVDNQLDAIRIAQTSDNTCTFMLNDLTLSILGSDITLGDIVVDNVNVVETDGVKHYNGTAEGLQLVVGSVNVEVEGTIDANNICDFKIDVDWKGMPINVTFTTNEIPAGIEGVSGDAVAVYGVAGAVSVNGYNGVVEVYAADGRLVKSVMVDGNAEISLNGGLYIVRAGSEAYKVFVK